MDEETFRLASIIVRALSVVATLLGFYIVARLALDKFYEEKRYDRLEKTYLQIIDGLSNMQTFARRLWEKETYGFELTEEDWRKLRSEFTQGWVDVDKAIFLFDFIIAKEASDVLFHFGANWEHLRNQRKRLSQQEFTEEQLHIIGICLQNFRRIAKQDLQVTKPKPFWKHPYFRGSRS